jgi:hypothetical protein
LRTTAVKVGVTVPEKEIWNPRERTPPAEIPLQTNQNISENVKNLSPKTLIGIPHILLIIKE